MSLCTFTGCGRAQFEDGLCPRHWQQRRAGSPLQPVRNHMRKAERERLHPRVLELRDEGVPAERIAELLDLRMTTVLAWLRESHESAHEQVAEPVLHGVTTD